MYSFTRDSHERRCTWIAALWQASAFHSDAKSLPGPANKINVKIRLSSAYCFFQQARQQYYGGSLTLWRSFLVRVNVWYLIVTYANESSLRYTNFIFVVLLEIASEMTNSDRPGVGAKPTWYGWLMEWDYFQFCQIAHTETASPTGLSPSAAQFCKIEGTHYTDHTRAALNAQHSSSCTMEHGPSAYK